MHRPVRETAASVRMHGLHDGTDRGMSGSGMYGLIAHTRVRDEPAFVRSMVSHHEEAVESARELRRSERPSMRRLGQRIAMTKTREIRLMRSWPEAWYPRTPAADESSMMRDLSLLNPHLNRDDLERTFLRDVIGHHMAAVMMSHRLGRPGLTRHALVGRLARHIARAQTDEILMMQRQLGVIVGGREAGRPSAR